MPAVAGCRYGIPAEILHCYIYVQLMRMEAAMFVFGLDFRELSETSIFDASSIRGCTKQSEDEQLSQAINFKVRASRFALHMPRHFAKKHTVMSERSS